MQTRARARSTTNFNDIKIVGTFKQQKICTLYLYLRPIFSNVSILFQGHLNS